MTTLKNDTFLRALLKQPTEYTPIWMMRQAGRYLPEYRELRAQAGSFMALCQNPELATEVTLQPLRRFSLDAAILFSDILTIPDAMGLGLSFAEGEGPRFAAPLRDEQAIGRLACADLDKLRYVFDAVGSIRKALDGSVPLIGFAGSPFTLACYMIDGGSSADFRHTKALMYSRPDLLHHILNINAQSVCAYLNEQIKAGAQAIQIFDTWGGVLTPTAYQTFSLSYMKQIMKGLIRVHEGREVPVILFTKGGGAWLEQMAETGANALGLDWTCDLHQARARVGDKVALQGNLDPSVLLANPETAERESQKVLEAFGYGSGHVFNLGHGISQFANIEAVNVLIETVHRVSPHYHTIA